MVYICGGVSTQGVTAYIALGSNLGNREAALRSAIAELNGVAGCRVERVSRFIETEPVGPPAQQMYLNGAAELATTLPARDLLGLMLQIEARHGRVRSAGQRWGPRTLDLDLLLYGNYVIDEPGLIVPHPRMGERAFVLAPLAEIAPSVVPPRSSKTIAQMLDALGSTA